MDAFFRLINVALMVLLLCFSSLSVSMQLNLDEKSIDGTNGKSPANITFYSPELDDLDSEDCFISEQFYFLSPAIQAYFKLNENSFQSQYELLPIRAPPTSRLVFSFS